MNHKLSPTSVSPFRLKRLSLLLPAAFSSRKRPILPGLLPTLTLFLAGAGLLGLPVMTDANPVGPQVVAGQATFNQQGNILTVTNTPNAIINWQNFSINADEVTRFLQQSSDSAVLNRIIGQNPSQILGALQSNGRVFLINPNGIVFGRGSQVNVNGLIASSLNLPDQDFLSGKRQLNGSASSGAVRNDGTITAGTGGQVYLIAPNVENNGIIRAPNGDLLLAAGHSVKLVDASNPDVQVVVSSPQALAVNLGQMIAQGGRIGIYGSLVKQGGRVNADSAVLGENGKIIFKASHDTLLDTGSQTSATSAGKGGEIQILGDRVALLGNASVDASGQQGGGSILVGGDMHGGNANVQNATRTIVDRNTSLRADAGQSGDGGKVIVWSNDTTSAMGVISARGGVQGGNGGFVETSGKKSLEFQAKVNVGAAKGKSGTLLLDPDSITLLGGSGDGSSSSDGVTTFQGNATPGTVLFSDPDLTSASVSNIFQSELEGLTPGVNLVLEAVNYIGVSNSRAFTSGLLTLPTNSSLTMRTRNGVSDGTGLKGINLTTGQEGSNLEIRAQGSGAITIQSGTGASPQSADILLPKLTTAGGTISVNGSGLVSVGKGMFTNGANVDITGNSVQLQPSAIVNAGTGNIAVTATGSGGISLGTNAALTVNGTATGSGVHLVTDNIDLASGTVNAGTNREVRINPNSSERSLDINSTKTGNSLELTPADLNVISAGDLVLNSTLVTSVSSPTNVTGATRLALFGPSVSIQSGLTLSGSGNIVVGANNLLDIGTNGSLSRNGSNGRIYLQADNMHLGGAVGSINGGSGGVAVVPNSNGTNIELGVGAATTTGILGLTAADLGTLTGSVVEIGNGNPNWDADTIVRSGGLTASINGGSGQLSLLGGKTNGNLYVNGPLAVTGNVNLVSNKLLQVAPGGGVTANNIALESNQIQLQGAAGSISSGTGITWITPHSSGTNINLGSTSDVTANTLELSNTELNTIGGTGVLRIGEVNKTAGMVISAPVAPTFTGVLSLQAGGAITETGTLTTDKLALNSVLGVNLAGANSVNKVAASVGDMSHMGNNFKLTSTQPLNVEANLDGRSGITVVPAGSFDPMSPAGVIALRSGGALTQSSSALLSSNALYAEGSNVDLTQHNPVGVIAGHSTGSSSSDMFHFSSQNGINVTTVDGFSGVQHDGAAGPMSICLKASSNGVGQDGTAPLISMMGGGVFLDTSGQVNMNSATNQVGMVSSAQNTGMFSFQNSAALIVGSGTMGVSTNDQPINISTSGGKLSVANVVNAGTNSVMLDGKNVDIASNINGSMIQIEAKQGSTGKIKTTANSIIGNNSTSNVLLKADNFDFTGGVLSVTTTPTGGTLGFVNHSKNGTMTIDSKMAGNYSSPLILFGTNNANASNTTSAININGAISQPASKLGFSAVGNVTENGSIAAQGIAVLAGSASLNGANQIHLVAGTTSGNFELTNTGTLSVTSFNTGQGTVSGISTTNSAVTINNTGAVSIDAPISSGSGAISVIAHSPLIVNAAVSSTSGNITLEAGSSNSTSDILTVSDSGSVTSSSGNILLRAGAAINQVGTISGSNVVRQPNLNGPRAPTLDQCIADPSLSGCSTVLPTLNNCIATPTLPGCSVVLPTITTCIATPSLPGCSAVLPTITACIATPTLPGCPAVLPTITACTTTPTLPGCTVVLPNIAACIASPTLPGCTVVLPTLTACIATPTLPGCSAVLPTITACIATPALPGCSAVLPTLATCIATPFLPGCQAVLPGIAACIATPTLPGCTVVLPNLAACIATPSLPGCAVVLPTLTACIATPTLPGCAVVLPGIAACIATPSLPGCTVVLPTLTACIATPTLPGCAAVLPVIADCIATPGLPGCTVVLPSIATCIATPGLPGCTVVLPTIVACIATPTLPGCTAVLPGIAACIATPSLPGCSVILPNLAACIATPSLEGCRAVLPNLTACIATPTLPGCSVILPNLAACIASPTLPGCSVVLPNINACIASPSLQGCSAVLPTIAQCTSNATLPGCAIVLPPTQQRSDQPLSEALSDAQNLINGSNSKPATAPVTIAPKPSAPTAPAGNDNGGNAGNGGNALVAQADAKAADAKSADSKPADDSKSTDKKEDKKETVVASKDAATAKKDEPVRKLYCN